MQLKRLGPYEIGKPLGKGGMGSVYEAVDSTTRQRVAIKALSPNLAMVEGFRERFEAEIDSLKTLRHDGIVRLYGYGEQDGVLFYSMEVVDGVSLEDEMKAGRRFTWREVTNIAIQLCLALKHAHDHGIIHRDIKPANILLYDEDKVKLADFGIARLFGTTQLTTAGGVLGTADYMSPEQADGRPVTARCDQYSLGGVMYALLAGRPPFRAKNLPQMLQLQRFAQAEPVRRYAPDTPEQLEHVIAQLLAKEPNDRYPNTQVLARHLRAMYMALSRPAADDFALATEQARIDPSHPDWEHSLVAAPTRAEAEVEGQNDADRARVAASASQEALTLAADELITAGNAGAEPSKSSPAKSAAPPSEMNDAISRPTIARFTTVEEDEARRLAEQQRSWLITGLQLVSLAALLSGMGWLAVYLSRPPTADGLYQRITSEANLEGDESLVTVEREVAEFLERFPNDSRIPELKQYEERISLDKLERKLQVTARGGNTLETLLPVETLYLQAGRRVDDSPGEAAEMLRSLIALYNVSPGPARSGDGQASKTSRAQREAEERQGAIVRLAKRRLKILRSAMASRIDRETTALKERLEAAQRVAIEEPARSAEMYRAIIELYGSEDWATAIVGVARERLAEIEKQDESRPKEPRS